MKSDREEKAQVSTFKFQDKRGAGRDLALGACNLSLLFGRKRPKFQHSSFKIKVMLAETWPLRLVTFLSGGKDSSFNIQVLTYKWGSPYLRPET